MLSLSWLHIKFQQDAVVTGSVDKGCGDIEVIQGEAAALQGDIVGRVVAVAIWTAAASEEDAALIAVVGKLSSGAVSASQ